MKQSEAPSKNVSLSHIRLTPNKKQLIHYNNSLSRWMMKHIQLTHYLLECGCPLSFLFYHLEPQICKECYGSPEQLAMLKHQTFLPPPPLLPKSVFILWLNCEQMVWDWETLHRVALLFGRKTYNKGLRYTYENIYWVL